MPKYNSSFVLTVWIESECIAPNREEAEARLTKKTEKLLNDHGFTWIDGKVEHCGTTNLSLLNKLPKGY